jgi:hypothetical protein
MNVKKKKSSIPNTTERALHDIALGAGLSGERGWRQSLANYLGIRPSRISQWILRDNISSEGKLLIHEKGFNLELEKSETFNSKSSINDLDEFSTQEPSPGSYGVPDLSGHKVNQVYVPADKSGTVPDEFLYLQKVSEILRSGKPGVAEALKSNILQFHEMVRMSDRLQALEAQRARDDTEKADMKEAIGKLEKALTRERNFDIGPAGCTAQTGSDDT